MEGHLNGIIFQASLELDDPDVELRVGSRSFMVHKKVLEKDSLVFKAQLSDNWRTPGDVLQLDEEYVDPEVVEELLLWLYYLYEDKKWDCTIENVFSLCVAADYLIISKMLAWCCGKLGENITPENIYDLFAFSNHHIFDDLRIDCVESIAEMPDRFLLSPQVVKWTAQELKIFIGKVLEVDDSSKVCETILSSLAIWTKGSFEERSRELEQLFKLVPPEALSSDALFRFMQTDFYSDLDEPHRKRYYVRPYLPPFVSSTDRLYCISRKSCSKSSKVHCLDLSAGNKWFQPISQQKDIFWKPSSKSVFGVSWRKNIYFLATLKFNPIEIFEDISNESDNVVVFGLYEPLKRLHRQQFAGAVLDDYIYTTVRSKPEGAVKSVHRYNLKTKLWDAIQEMQAARLAHQLVTLNSSLYAIGGEVPEPSSNLERPNEALWLSPLTKVVGYQKMFKIFGAENRLEKPFFHECKLERVARPERYDPQTQSWEYIAPSYYHHEHPAAVAHKGQIYVLSQASFECYSPETDRWTQLPVPDVCRWPFLVSIAGRLWLLTELSEGVYSSSRIPNISRLVYEFNVLKQEWTRLPDMPDGDYTDFAFVVKQ